ncbi:MAG: glycosyltransferase family 2 protein [Flavobacteriales bacterium]|nr:glycosyltransferase family 2 protein [Flavobacteriales bacterium]
MEHRTQRPKVSIVVIAYQQVHYIAQCLDGILMQRTTFPIEVLVGDDGSTDGTRELCMRYARDHPEKVKLFLREQSDRNPAHPPGRDNLLALLHAATGEYITRCDGDDYWTDPVKLQQQADHLDAHPDHAGCFHWVQSIDEHTGEKGLVYGDHGDKQHFTVEDTLTVRSICHPSGFMYRCSALPVLPHWLGRMISADITMYSLVAGSGELFCMPQVMGVYRKHDASVTASEEHRGSLYHRRRIILWLHIDRHYSSRYSDRCQLLFLHHWWHILQQNSPSLRAKHVWAMIRAVPGWFLTKPFFTMARLREVLTGTAGATASPLPSGNTGTRRL